MIIPVFRRCKALAALALVLLAICSAPAATKLNFNQVDIKEFIKFAADYSGLNLVYNVDSVKGQITVYSPGEATEEDVMQILDTILNLYGYSAARDGNMLVITSAADGARYAGTDLVSAAEARGTQAVVYRMDYIDPKDFANIIKPLVSPRAYIHADSARGQMILVDSSTNAQRVQALLAKLDVFDDANLFLVLEPQHYSSFSMVEKLQTLLGKEALAGVSLLPVREENRVYVYGARRGVRLVKETARGIDLAFEEKYDGVFVERLRFSNAEDVATVLGSVFKDLQSAGTPVTFTADKSSNSIVVRCEENDYRAIQEVIAKLDEPTRQVYIEALILETSLGNTDKLGVTWTLGGGDSDNLGVIGQTSAGASPEALFNVASAINDEDGSSAASLAGVVGNTGFNFGFIGNMIEVNGVKFPTITAMVNALEGRSMVNILSNPRILTLNNTEAEVFVGENRAFETNSKVTDNGTSVKNYEYKDVGVKLRVTPRIADNNVVKMDLYQEIKTAQADEILQNKDGETLPKTLTRSTKTSVQVPSGYTVVISGLIEESSTLSKDKVPCLGDVPLFGGAFRNSSSNEDKKNVMVFVTPYVVTDAKDLHRHSQDEYNAYDRFFRELYGEVMSIHDQDVDSGEIDNPADRVLERSRLQSYSDTEASPAADTGDTRQ